MGIQIARTIAVGALTVCAGCAHVSEATVLPNPEIFVCPPTPGDLESGLYTMMTAAKFVRWEGAMSWRRRTEGPFHALSLEAAQWLHVKFDAIYTSRGTRLIADLTWRTSAYEFGVKEKEVVNGFQSALDGVRTAFPCPLGSE